MNNILVAICGLGNPQGAKKINGCLKNIDLIKSTAPTDSEIHIKIFCYDDLALDQFASLKNCHMVRETGIVGEFIYRHLSPNEISSYDRIILLMDDITLSENFNLSSLMKLQDKYSFDIVSPSATQESVLARDFMRHRAQNQFKNKVFCVNFLEFFFYMFNLKDSDAYSAWHSMFDEKTQWMWGIDLILSPVLNLKLGLTNDMTFHHQKYGGGLSSNGRAEAQNFLKRFGLTAKTLEKQLKINRTLSTLLIT